MTAQTTAAPQQGQILRNFRLAIPALGIGLLVLGVLFHAEVAAAVNVWMDSTAYNHCFLVLPIVAYLLWDRRELFATAIPTPSPWAGLAALPVILVWLFAERLGIMEGRQLMVMTLVEILLFCVLGVRLWYQLCGPLLYLYFLVPFGAFIVPSLQDFTTSFIVHGLNILNVPNYSDGRTIEIPEGSFLVAEACAGLRFLIASFAFGCLYALLVYRSALRRAVFILVSLVVPIIANGFRALGIVVLGHILGSAEAATADHLIYGWVFFSAIILLQIAIGLPFRQDHRSWTMPARPVAPRVQPAARQTAIRTEARGSRGVRRRSIPWYLKVANALERQSSAVIAASMKASGRPVSVPSMVQATAIPLVLAAIGPACVIGIGFVGGTRLPATLPTLSFSGPCAEDPARPMEHHDGVGRTYVQYLTCGQEKFIVQTEIFSVHTGPSRIIAALRELSGEEGAEVNSITTLAAPPGMPSWRVVETMDPARTTASTLWLNGNPAQVSFDMRTHQAWASIVGAAYAPIIVSITPDLNWSNPTLALRNHARDLLARFAQTYQSMPDQINRLSYAAAH